MEGWALAYEVTARKWRPQEFDGVIGQEHVTTTLKNAIQAGQIAHAYLFAGPRGVGKTTTARILAKALNCVEGPTVTPCNACTFCQEISEGRSVDVLEIDGASNNRVEQVRTHLLESVKYTPSQGKHKIYIIDEVHMLTKEAFNALLKTLEEPPAHVYFIFATTDPRKVIPTVLSRCQRFDFRRISGPTIVDHLAMISEQSGYDVQREALALIARRVDGSMRDAESLLDQVVAFGGTALTAREAAEVLGIVDQDVYFELLDIVAEQDVPKGLDLVDRIFGQGHDLEEIVLGILEHLRNLLVVKAAPEAEVLIGDAALALDRFREQAGRFETEDLLRLSQLATQMEQSVKNSALPRVQLETGVVRMIRIARSVQLTDVMTRLSEMARRVGTGEGGAGAEGAGDGGEASGTEASGTEASGTETSGTETSSKRLPKRPLSLQIHRLAPHPDLHLPHRWQPHRDLHHPMMRVKAPRHHRIIGGIHRIICGHTDFDGILRVIGGRPGFAETGSPDGPQPMACHRGRDRQATRLPGQAVEGSRDKEFFAAR